MTSYVYLLHFNKPYKHAKHYLGSTTDLSGRLHQHSTGNGSRLIQVITENGLTFTLAKLWTFNTEQESRLFEKTLKRQKNTPRFCPICKSNRKENYV